MQFCVSSTILTWTDAVCKGASGANLPGKPCALGLRADSALRRTTGRRSEDVWCAADMPGFEVFKIHPAVSIRMRVREKLHENIRLLLLLRRKCRCFLRSRNKQIYRCDRLIWVPDATKRYPPFRKWRIPFCFGLHIIGTEILSQFRQVCKWQNRNS